VDVVVVAPPGVLAADRLDPFLAGRHLLAALGLDAASTSRNVSLAAGAVFVPVLDASQYFV
jgi:hypothetical protein